MMSIQSCKEKMDRDLDCTHKPTKMAQGSREVAKTRQKPQVVEYTFQELQQARKEEINERKTTRAKEQALRKRDQATKQEVAARRQAERLDMNLQKQLTDRYGYGRCCSPSAAADSPDIELTPIKLAEEIEAIPKERGPSRPAAMMSVIAPMEHENDSRILGDEGPNPSNQELSDATGEDKGVDEEVHDTGQCNGF